MQKNYFSPTTKFKGYLVLELIFKTKNITQREIAKKANIALAMVNQYLKDYEEKGFIVKDYVSKKFINYSLTNKGIEYMRWQNIGYLAETQNLYNQAKEDMTIFLNKLVEKKYRDIILYGAGEVAEIILQTLNDNKSILLNVISLIDDDIAKQGKKISNVTINSVDYIDKVKHDAIMISSYAKHKEIMLKLINRGYDANKIEYFFK